MSFGRAFALDETRSRRVVRQALSLRRAEARVSRASVGTVEIRPKRERKTHPLMCPHPRKSSCGNWPRDILAPVMANRLGYGYSYGLSGHVVGQWV